MTTNCSALKWTPRKPMKCVPAHNALNREEICTRKMIKEDFEVKYGDRWN